MIPTELLQDINIVSQNSTVQHISPVQISPCSFISCVTFIVTNAKSDNLLYYNNTIGCSTYQYQTSVQLLVRTLHQDSSIYLSSGNVHEVLY